MKSSRFQAASAALCLLCLAASGCADTNTSQCNIGADCASGICLSDGSCRPLGEDAQEIDDQGGEGGEGDLDPPVDMDSPDGEEPQGDMESPDAAPDAAQDMEGDAEPPDMEEQGCRPVRDGMITRQELPVQTGLSARYRSTQDAAVDLTGQEVEGVRTWDFSGDLPGDHLTLIETQPVGDKWFADSFPEADYAARLSDAEELLGVFRWEEERLLLLGVVSPQGGFTRTELEYDPPVPVLQLPLSEGATWEVESTVSGLVLGVYSFYFEDYTYRVDAAGEVITPYGTFPTLRVRADLTRTVGLLPTDTRSYVFMTECFGSVATVVSQSNEDELEFSQAAELRRLAP